MVSQILSPAGAAVPSRVRLGLRGLWGQCLNGNGGASACEGEIGVDDTMRKRGVRYSPSKRKHSVSFIVILGGGGFASQKPLARKKQQLQAKAGAWRVGE
jgi:hypothetical protein